MSYTCAGLQSNVYDCTKLSVGIAQIKGLVAMFYIYIRQYTYVIGENSSVSWMN